MKKYFLLIIAIFTISIANAQNPTGTSSIVHQRCYNDGIIAVNVTSGMTLPLTYTYYSSYYSNIVAIHSNINAFTDTLYNASYPGYYVQIHDNSGHTLNLSQNFNNPFTIDYPINFTSPICPDTLGTGYVTINGGAVPLSVQWYNSDTYPWQYITTGNPGNLPINQYIPLVFIVTDSNGCTNYHYVDTIYLEQITNISFNFTTTSANCTNGSATISNITGSNPPFTYLWDNGATTPSINNLISGYYPVTITDSIGCAKYDWAYVPQAITITVNKTVTNATCLQNNGSVITFGSGGTPPYTYHYSNGANGQTLSGLSGGTQLQATVTDANGCYGQGSIYIYSTTPISTSYSTTPSSCTVPTGTAYLNISGGNAPYTIVWNTFPQQTGITLSNVLAGLYSFKVTDAVGCVQTGTVNVPAQSTIYASISTTNCTCPNILGTATANVSGSNPPFTFVWSNGAVTQNIINLNAGYYSCTIKDSLGCTLTKNASINTISPINIGFSTTSATCIFTNNGSIHFVATGGTAPYTYIWSTGQTTQTITNQFYGWYNVTVHDANGCVNQKSVYLGYNINNDSCYCTVTGKVFVDIDNDCIYDAGETTVEHIMIHCSDNGYSFTDANGVYSFIVPSGSYTLSENVQYYYPLASCQSNNISINATASSGCVITNNIANIINPINDIHLIRTELNAPVPGNTYTQMLIIENEGTISESNIQVGAANDGQLTYTNSSPNLFTQTDPINYPHWFSINSDFPTLSAGATQIITTNYNVPTNIPLATTINFYDSASYTPPMSNWLNDYSPWNNVNNYQATVVGSFDPNFKEVIPKGTDTLGYIKTSDSVLTYIIHFENTGTYYAQNIVITDTLDNNLNWNTLRPGYSDYNYKAELSENGVLKFTFANINLPQSNSANNTGLVTYSIKLKDNLNDGTHIRNKAAIYFDYNAPVITNTTLNTISKYVGINEINHSSDLKIYPNPTKDNITIETNLNNEQRLEIINLIGQTVYTTNINNKKTLINTSAFANGVYILKLSSDKETVVRKFVKE